ncbi:MAG: conjugal transfer protein TraR [Ignavibacteriales bacterium]
MATKSDKKNVKKATAEKTKPAKTSTAKSSIPKNGNAKSAPVKKTGSKAVVKDTVAKAKEKEKPKKKTVQTKVKDVMKKEKDSKSTVKKEKEVKVPVQEAAKEKAVAVDEYSAPEVIVTSPKKNIRKIKGYGKEDLEYFKKIILDKRNEIIEQLQNLREQMMDPTTGQYVNENSPYSLHMAEQGTDAMEREKIFLWAQRENKFLGYLDDALHRIENGTYGICIECIDEPQNLCPTCPLIAKERLAAVPHSQLCLPVKQKQEKK